MLLRLLTKLQLKKARLDTSFADNQSPSDEDQELAQQTIE
jgi:hypothetical protein